MSVSGNELVWFQLTWDIIWSINKANIYFIYIYRLHITFKDSKYAYPPRKIYIVLIFALLLQLYNMLVFITNIFKSTNKSIIIILSSIYLILNFMLVMMIMVLFMNPIINLMVDLRTKSEQLMKINNGSETQNLSQHTNENESSSEEILFEETVPHSPTKMGASYRKIKIPKSPTQEVAETSLQRKKSSIDPKLRHVRGRLACPEDEMKDDAEEDDANSSRFTFGFLSKFNKSNGIVWNEKQKQILNTGTRLALLSVIGLSSQFIYQFMWIFSLQYAGFSDVSYTWGIDTCINIICIYLSFHFAEREYNMLCAKCCHCHICCLRCVGNIAKKRVG